MRLTLGRRNETQEFIRGVVLFRHPKKKEVALLLLGIPARIEHGKLDAVIAEFKDLKKSMKEDDRRQGRA